MLQADFFHRKKVLMLGLGLHGGGESTVRWLYRHGATVRVTDKKSSTELQATIRRLKNLSLSWTLGKHRWADFAWADLIVQNPGVPDTVPELQRAVRAGKVIMNEATIFLSQCPAVTIGVTGTRGKTTTATLLGHLLSQNKRRTIVAGNVRTIPMLSIVDRLKVNDRVVLELSSFQLEKIPAIKRSTDIGVITNVLVDHLNRYRSMREYAQAKFNLIRWLGKHGVAVLNYDAPVVRKAAVLTKARVLWYSAKSQPSGWAIFLRSGWVLERVDGHIKKIVAVKSWLLPGVHQRTNLLAAVAAARAAGV